MMDPFAADIDRAITQLTMMERAIIQALPKGAEAGAKVLLAAATRAAPVRKGTLRASAFDEAVDNDRTSASHRVGFDTFYALPVDRGHPIRTQRGGPVVGRAKAVPFLSDPVARLRKTTVAKAVTSAVAEETDSVIRRYNRR